MKAIVIKFEGAIKDEPKLASKLSDVIGEYTSAEEGDITILNDEEVTTALIRMSIVPTVINIKENKEDSILKQIESLCKDIITHIGATSLKPLAVHNSDLIAYLISTKNQYSELLSKVAKINGNMTYTRHREVLKNYGLEHMPELIRDINPIIKLF